MKRYTLIFALTLAIGLVLVSLSVSAEEPTYWEPRSININPSPAIIGEKVTLHITVEAPASEQTIIWVYYPDGQDSWLIAANCETCNSTMELVTSFIVPETASYWSVVQACNNVGVCVSEPLHAVQENHIIVSDDGPNAIVINATGAAQLAVSYDGQHFNYGWQIFEGENRFNTGTGWEGFKVSVGYEFYTPVFVDQSQNWDLNDDDTWYPSHSIPVPTTTNTPTPTATRTSTPTPTATNTSVPASMSGNIEMVNDIPVVAIDITAEAKDPYALSVQVNGGEYYILINSIGGSWHYVSKNAELCEWENVCYQMQEGDILYFQLWQHQVQVDKLTLVVPNLVTNTPTPTTTLTSTNTPTPTRTNTPTPTATATSTPVFLVHLPSIMR